MNNRYIIDDLTCNNLAIIGNFISIAIGKVFYFSKFRSIQGDLFKVN